ncbi:MAG: serine/threonine-protein kinase [Cyanobacteria bacterium J06632_22]
MTHSVSLSSEDFPRPHSTELALKGRYTLKETLGVRLGRRTLLGYDHAHNVPVIVKYLCADDPIHPSDSARFEREVQLLRQLDHGAIPAYVDDFSVDTDTHKGRLLVQSFIPGHSLFSQIRQGRRFTEHELKRMAGQVLTILQYLHQHQIIHRDIKPSNLVLSSANDGGLGTLYLVDFGLVQMDVKLEEMVISGTDGYRPPEQLGDQATPASDLYALGMTLIHLATGRHPNELPHRGLKVLFAQELGHLSRPFKHWLRWLTEPRQTKRPQSATEALAVLRDVEQVFAKRLSARRLGQAIAQKARSPWQFLETAKPQGTQVQLQDNGRTLEVIIPASRFRGMDQGIWRTVRSSVVGLVGLSAVGLALALLADIAVEAMNIAYGWSVVAIALLFGLFLVAANTMTLWRSLSSLLSRFRRRVHIQLEQDILLVGYASPLQPMQYMVNAYRQDVFDIDLRPDKTRLHLFLMRNRTCSGQLNYTLSAQELGLKPSEMHWLNDLLHVWLKRTSPTF